METTGNLILPVTGALIVVDSGCPSVASQCPLPCRRSCNCRRDCSRKDGYPAWIFLGCHRSPLWSTCDVSLVSLLGEEGISSLSDWRRNPAPSGAEWSLCWRPGNWLPTGEADLGSTCHATGGTRGLGGRGWLCRLWGLSWLPAASEEVPAWRDTVAGCTSRHVRALRWQGEGAATTVWSPKATETKYPWNETGSTILHNAINVGLILPGADSRCSEGTWQKIAGAWQTQALRWEQEVYLCRAQCLSVAVFTWIRLTFWL